MRDNNNNVLIYSCSRGNTLVNTLELSGKKSLVGDMNAVLKRLLI